jgi:dipeptidase E
MYPFPNGGIGALGAFAGKSSSPLAELGWRTLGVLEPSALPTVRREAWVSTVESADALLVFGGNVLYLTYWLRHSGLTEVLDRLDSLVYVGVSAGSIAMTAHNCDAPFNLEWVPEGSDMGQGAERGLGYVDIGLWVHMNHPHPQFADHAEANIAQWATSVAEPTYALDDQSALVVRDGEISVVSEGEWRLYRSL